MIKIKTPWIFTLYKMKINRSNNAAPAKAESNTTHKGTGSASCGGNLGAIWVTACWACGGLSNGVPIRWTSNTRITPTEAKVICLSFANYKWKNIYLFNPIQPTDGLFW